MQSWILYHIRHLDNACESRVGSAVRSGIGGYSQILGPIASKQLIDGLFVVLIFRFLEVN